MWWWDVCCDLFANVGQTMWTKLKSCFKILVEPLISWMAHLMFVCLVTTHSVILGQDCDNAELPSSEARHD
jgi:hypothetical protein